MLVFFKLNGGDPDTLYNDNRRFRNNSFKLCSFNTDTNIANYKTRMLKNTSGYIGISRIHHGSL